MKSLVTDDWVASWSRQGGVDPARGNAVDPDATLDPLHGEGTRQLDDRALACHVGACLGERSEPPDRREVDDAAAAP